MYRCTHRSGVQSRVIAGEQPQFVRVALRWRRLWDQAALVLHRGAEAQINRRSRIQSEAGGRGQRFKRRQSETCSKDSRAFLVRSSIAFVFAIGDFGSHRIATESRL